MSTHDNAVSARADLIGAAAWMAFGIAIVAGALAMDRLEQFGATAYTAPGLVPGVLGAMIALLGLLLAIRALRAGALAEARTASWSPSADTRAALRRAGVATVLSLGYTLGLIGRIPFEIATAAFVFVFIMVFGVSPDDRRTPARRALVAGVTAIATTIVVAMLFERVFLVRLP